MVRREFLKYLAIIPVVGQFDFFSSKYEKTEIQNLFASSEAGAAVRAGELASIWTELKVGDHLVIGGRPGMGKSTVATNILNELCLNQKNTAIYFSIEESSKKLVNRMLAIRANVSLGYFNSGRFEDNDLIKIVEQSEVISNSNLYLNDSGDLKIEGMVEVIKAFKAQHTDLKYVFVDYLQLIDASKNFNTRSESMNYILAELKKVAIAEKLIIISLSQLNKNIGPLRPFPRVENLREIKDLTHIDKITLVHSSDFSDLNLQSLVPKQEMIDFLRFDKKTGKYVQQVATLDRHTQRILGVYNL